MCRLLALYEAKSRFKFRAKKNISGNQRHKSEFITSTSRCRRCRPCRRSTTWFSARVGCDVCSNWIYSLKLEYKSSWSADYISCGLLCSVKLGNSLNMDWKRSDISGTVMRVTSLLLCAVETWRHEWRDVPGKRRWVCVKACNMELAWMVEKDRILCWFMCLSLTSCCKAAVYFDFLISLVM
jgi:hypothetical protein